MMKLIAGILVFITGFAAGTFFGFRKAPQEFLLWDSQHRAALYAFENAALNERKLNMVINANEIRINAELAQYGRHLDSKLFWLLDLAGTYDEDEENIRHAVQYRLANPYNEPDMSMPTNWRNGTDMESDFVQGVIAGQKENRAQMQKVIELYRQP